MAPFMGGLARGAIWGVPGERSANGTADHLSHRPTLEDHFSKIRVDLQEGESAPG